MKIKCFLLEDTGKVRVLENCTSPIYKRTDTGDEMTWQEAPIGAMMDADWMQGTDDIGLDGKSLIVKTPGGDWYIDSQAANCTKPNDKIHKCWCRHGVPPNITVNKVGNTCAAGGGSILMGNKYHGFLINGELIEC